MPIINSIKSENIFPVYVPTPSYIFNVNFKTVASHYFGRFIRQRLNTIKKIVFRLFLLCVVLNYAS